MESLYLLLPVSVLLVLALVGLFAWALHGGQFDDLEREGWRVLEATDPEPAPPTVASRGITSSTGSPAPFEPAQPCDHQGHRS